MVRVITNAYKALLLPPYPPPKPFLTTIRLPHPERRPLQIGSHQHNHIRSYSTARPRASISHLGAPGSRRGGLANTLRTALPQDEPIQPADPEAETRVPVAAQDEERAKAACKEES